MSLGIQIDLVVIPKSQQGFDFVKNEATRPILDVVRALLALSPFLQKITRNTDNEGRSLFV